MANQAASNRVVIFCKSIPQYRGRFFELLRERLAENGIELELVYGEPSREDADKHDSIDLPWATKTRNVSCRLNGRELIWQSGLSRVRRGDLVVVEQASKLLLNYILFAAAAIGVIRFAFWGHGHTTRLQALTSQGERAKAYMSRRAWWWFAYNERSATYVRQLGYPDERITRVQNAIDTTALVAAARHWDNKRLTGIRSELGLRGNNVCVFIGAMYQDKQLPFLVAACEIARSLLPDFEMIFIGDGPQSRVVSEAAAQFDWIHYLGPKFNGERVPYLLDAKLLLMPGGVGLCVLDSFALRVPLVTTSTPAQGPEIEYLQHGVNGIIAAGEPNPAEYAQVVVDALQDEQLRERLQRGCEQSSVLYTIEAMADNFAAGAVKALSAKP